jgi:hypothetical protein
MTEKSNWKPGPYTLAMKRISCLSLKVKDGYLKTYIPDKEGLCSKSREVLGKRI